MRNISVPCPIASHGVQSHIAGSAAAIACSREQPIVPKLQMVYAGMGFSHSQRPDDDVAYERTIDDSYAGSERLEVAENAGDVKAAKYLRLTSNIDRFRWTKERPGLLQPFNLVGHARDIKFEAKIAKNLAERNVATNAERRRVRDADIALEVRAGRPMKPEWSKGVFNVSYPLE